MNTTKPDERTAVIDESQDAGSGGGGQGSSSGGNLAREVGQRDELKNLEDEDPQPTGVDKRDKPEDGDLPTRLQTRK